MMTKPSFDPVTEEQLGTVETLDDGSKLLRYERRLSHPPERVWRAITDPNEIVGWLARAEVELTEGGAFNLEWLNSDDPDEEVAASMNGEITELEPGRVLEVRGDAHGTLRWELRPDGDGTALTFTNRPPEGFASQVLSGWHVHLDFLDVALDGRPLDMAADWRAWGRDRWQEIDKAYGGSGEIEAAS